jgi:primosomal protein N' (replication factor Y)
VEISERYGKVMMPEIEPDLKDKYFRKREMKDILVISLIEGIKLPLN